jgi:D-Tyr-tRNAtyr deacylase
MRAVCQRVAEARVRVAVEIVNDGPVTITLGASGRHL